MSYVKFKLSQSLILQTATLNLVFTPTTAVCRKFTEGSIGAEKRHVPTFHLVTEHHHSVPQILNVTIAEQKASHPTLFLLQKSTMIYHERMSEQRATINAIIRALIESCL